MRFSLVTVGSPCIKSQSNTHYRTVISLDSSASVADNFTLLYPFWDVLWLPSVPSSWGWGTEISHD